MGLHTWMPVICNMSITASAVILIILPVRILLKKMPKIFSYLLWGVVLFRLLCPFSVPSPFSLLGIFEDAASDRAVMEYIPAEYLYQDDFVSSAVGEKKAGDGGFPAGHGEKTKTSALLSVLTYVWAAGVAGMLCLNGINLYRLRKRIAGAICIGENVYESDYIISPFVMGLFCPKIYMPSSLTEQERYFILLHEKSHRKQGECILPNYFSSWHSLYIGLILWYGLLSIWQKKIWKCPVMKWLSGRRDVISVLIIPKLCFVLHQAGKL